MGKTLFSVVSLASATLLQAVVPFVWETDGTGAITTGSWDGTSGTVQANVAPGSPTTTSLAIADITSGTGSVDFGLASGRINSGVTTDFTISVTGGSADLTLTNSNSLDGGSNQWNNFTFSGLAGVTELTITFTPSELIAGRTNQTSNIISRPLMSAFGVLDAGAVDLADIGVSMNVLSPYYSSNGTDFASFAGEATPVGSANWGTLSQGQTSFDVSGVNQTVSISGGGNAGWHLLRGYDDENNDTYAAEDADDFYVSGMQWTITADAGTFDDNTELIFSFDGRQYSNLPIPEPSTGFLISLLLGGLMLRKKRH